MNKSYRVIWNELLNAWVAVAEIAKVRGKRSSRAVLLTGTLAAVSPAPTFAQAPSPHALPTGGQVVAGQAAIAQSGATMNITQATQRAAIDWRGFNVGSGATVNFIQPSASAVALNRVFSGNPSQIFGNLNANGQVFLTNAAGVYFGPTASVNVGALVATTHSISNADFMAGNDRFTRNGATGSVVNDGNLNADINGYIALLAPEVRNHGVVIAQLGTVALAAGDAYTLQFDGGRLAGVEVQAATMAALVENGQAVQAPGGLIILSARAADHVLGSVVHHTGTLEASSLTERGGVIRLEGDQVTLASDSQIKATGATGGGEVYVGGGWQGAAGMAWATTTNMAQGATIDASATQHGDGGTVVLWSDVNNPDSLTAAHGGIAARGGPQGGNGGRVETSGHRLDTAGIRVDASAEQGQGGRGGEWLLDPYNVVIDDSASGTAYDASYTPTADSHIQASAIAASLQNGTSVTITTGTAGGSAGDITVDAAITKVSGNTDVTLTLKAANNIILNSSISSSSGKLDTVLWADSDASGGGYIKMSKGSAITTNGGHLWMGGGSGSTTWNGLTVGDAYATGIGTNDGSGLGADGIHIDGASLNTAGGNIALHGKSSATASLTAGIRTNDVGNGSTVTTFDSGTGTILLDGVSLGTGAIAGVELNSQNSNATTTITSANTTANAITINADASSAGTGGWGLLSYYGTTISATGSGGGITITGKINGSGGRAIGLHSPGQTGTQVLANGGPIVFNAVTNGAGSSLYAKGDGMAVGQLAGSAVPTSSSDITLNIDRSMEGSSGNTPDISFNSSGALTVRPLTAGTTTGIAGGAGAVQLPANLFATNFVGGFSSITLGSAAAGAITIGGAITFKDDTTLQANGASAVNGATTANKNLKLSGNGGITQTAKLAVTGTAELTAGTGADITLTHTANDFSGAVSVTSARNLALVDSNAMTLGAVSTAGTIDIATLTNDLTLTDAVATTDTTASAISLNADKNAAACTATGRNLIVSGGSISVGSGGTAKLYSGGVSGSTGLAALAGGSGSGRYRYNSDETATNYTTALSAGANAIYREQPTVTITANAASKTYDGNVYSGGNGATYSGLVNGDTSAAIGGALSYGGDSQTAKNAGTYAITPGGLANGLGYALAYADGALTVNKAQLTVTADDQSRLYGATNPTFTQTITGFVNGENASVVSGSATGSSAADATTGVGAATITASTSGLSATNYDFTAANGTLTITQRPITVTADDKSKTYGAVDPALTWQVTSGSLVNSDTLNGVLTRAAGNNVGAYGIDASALSNGNYLITANNGTLTIGRADATVTANSSNLTYNGQTQSISGFTASGLMHGETESVLTSVAASGASGVNAGSYTNTVSGNAIEGNYNLTFVNGVLTISAAHLALTGNLIGSVSKKYDGTKTAALTPANYSLTGFFGSDGASVTKTTGTFADANAGSGKMVTVALASGDFSPSLGTNLANYVLPTSLSGNIGIIEKADAIVTANSGNLTYNGQTQSVSGFTASGLFGSDALTGVSAGGSGRNAGTYVTTASGADDNYNLTFVDGALTIGKADAIVTANSGNLTYNGQTQSVSGFTASGLFGSDALTGVSAGGSGRNAGTYVTTASGADDNYNLTFVDGALIIGKKDLDAVVGITAKNKAYDDTTAAALDTGSASFTGMVAGDRLGVASATGAFNDKDVGAGKVVVISGITLGGADAGNYNLIDTTAIASADIASLPAPPPNPPPPAPPMPNSSPGVDGSVASSDSGSISSGGGSGGLTSPGSSLGGSFSGGDFSPSSASGAPSGGNAASGGPSATPTVGSEAGGSGITVTLVKEPSVLQGGIVTVSVPKETAMSGAGFNFPLPAQVVESGAANATVSVTTPSGEPLPGWLSFNAETKVFSASVVPDGALPVQVLVTIGDQRTIVVITERER